MKMSFLEKLNQITNKNNSYLCVGLDPNPKFLPEKFKNSFQIDGIYNFCIEIINSTFDLVNCFKPQIAYFSAFRSEKQLEKIIKYIKINYPEIPIILDAKRGDIGATSKMYAMESFERYQADAVTLSPFMGFDSVQPYLDYLDKGVFLLCRTSNPSGDDLQNQSLKDVKNQPKLFEHVANLAQNNWNLNKKNQVGLVVGATRPEEIKKVRKIAPDVPLLIPGIGIQGGNILETIKATGTKVPIIINSSRAILYASNGKNFDLKAREQAEITVKKIREAVNEVKNKSLIF